MEEWVTCDEDLPEQTDAEIIQLTQDKARDDSSDMDHDVSIQKPPVTNVRKAIHEIFVCVHKWMDTGLLDINTVMKRLLWQLKLGRKKQLPTIVHCVTHSWNDYNYWYVCLYFY